ncbi:MAG: putative O-glycosylation ligase, exosortase A system-associated [Gammaproteobacteria bacterium]|nr:putative O-glycosylation ligase, exosortase A system-associated [Gammaproteobacteria bacterium]
MRDLAVTLIVIGSIPYILMRPYVGILMMAWLGYMNPHRLSWGFATDMPFVFIMAIVTMIGMVFSKEKIGKLPIKAETILLFLFLAWMGITTIFALEPSLAKPQYEKVIKIQVITILTMLLITDKKRVLLLIWVIVMSLGFYGFKGGIFTITSGGGFHVMGPLGTFIGGNNEIGLALVMTLPLMYYLLQQQSKKIIKLGMMALMFLTAVAILGTQSRGALVGIVMMGAYLVLKSKRKFTFLIVLAAVIPIILTFMPQSWWDRMHTIKAYEQDESALGRINAWNFAMNLASARPLGGGYEVFKQPWFSMYAPDPDVVHDAHSIYFEVLGEHGFVGLALFLALLLTTWFSGRKIIRTCRGKEDLLWAENLARMLQVSLAGYMVCGAFLGLAYFDYVYHIVAIMVLLKVIVLGQADDNSPLKRAGRLAAK